MNIRVNLKTNIADGSEVVFRSPADCSQVTGLVIYHTGGKTEFAFADAHGNNVGDIDHLFAENAVVKVILDVTAGMAFVQNADTNAYIERTFVKSVNSQIPDETGNVKLTADDVGALRADALQDGVNLALQQAKDSGAFDGKDGTDGKDGKDGKDGNDYILTESDKEEIAGMIPVPEMPGGGCGNVVSVKDHGAVGDGITDDTEAIQAALDASHALGGGTVFIPNGAYLLSDAVKFYSNQHIIGEPHTVLLQKDGSTGVAYSNDGKCYCNVMRNYYNGAGGYDATENVVIEGITFDGGSQDETATTTLGFCHSRNIRVVNCTFTNGYSDSTYSNGHDIEVNSSSNVTISGCTFRNNRRLGYTSELVQIDNASGSQAYPWEPDEGSRKDDGTVSDTILVDGCLFFGTARDILAEKNVFVGGHSSTGCRNVIVSNCIMRNGSYGVKFGTVDGVTVKNNNIDDTAVGLYITDTVDSALAVGNVCIGDVQRVYPATRVKGYGNMLNGVHVEEPESGSGIDVSGAVPGQIPMVKEVDENGVPTAWETAEPPMGGDRKQWELVKEFTLTESVKYVSLYGFEGTEIYVQHHLAIDSKASNTGTSIDAAVKGVAIDGNTGAICIPNITVAKDTPNTNVNSATYSNGAFAISWSNGGLNWGSKLYGSTYKNTALLTKINGFTLSHGSNDGRIAAGSTIKIYVR